MIALIVVARACYPQGSFLFEANDARFGQGSLTVDARTGLIWLDVPTTRDLSMTQMWKAFEPGGRFSGFRWATRDEVTSLFQTAGIKGEFIAPGTTGFANVQSLLALVGTTTENLGKPGISGLAVQEVHGLIYSDEIVGYHNTTTPSSGITQWGFDTHDPTVGHWLVIPEPTSFTILLVGAILFRSFRRK